MFERYTEKARRVIFFARYEATQFGLPYVETEHLLLGLLRENPALTSVCSLREGRLMRSGSKSRNVQLPGRKRSLQWIIP